jgi:antitoxin ParD1/3/4
MNTTRKTITLSAQQDAWVKSRIESGDYTNDSEYFRDMVRRDQEASRERVLLAAIREGLDSGISHRSVKDIWSEAERRHQAKRG